MCNAPCHDPCSQHPGVTFGPRWDMRSPAVEQLRKLTEIETFLKTPVSFILEVRLRFGVLVAIQVVPEGGYGARLSNPAEKQLPLTFFGDGALGFGQAFAAGGGGRAWSCQDFDLLCFGFEALHQVLNEAHVDMSGCNEAGGSQML